MSKLDRLIKLCTFDKNGESQWISKTELDEKVYQTSTTNGRNYSFIKQGGNYLYEFNSDRAKLRVIKQKHNAKKSVPSKFREILKDQPCVISGLRDDIEIDHKAGREEDPDFSRIDTITLFQPMLNKLNYKKREYCNKQCKVSNLRYDAKELNYKKGWSEGGANFEGVCKGCYYYDPVEFRSKL